MVSQLHITMVHNIKAIPNLPTDQDTRLKVTLNHLNLFITLLQLVFTEVLNKHLNIVSIKSHMETDNTHQLTWLFNVLQLALDNLKACSPGTLLEVWQPAHSD